jgi:hypothetical protein
MLRVLRIAERSQGRAGRALVGLALTGLLAGCSLPTAATDPLDGSRPGTPIERTENPRAGRISFRLDAVDRGGAETRVDLTVWNASGTSYGSVQLRVIAVGPAGERRGVRLLVGSLGAGQERRVSARFPELGFPVSDVQVEIVYRS